jgi:hypothetical protein
MAIENSAPSDGGTDLSADEAAMLAYVGDEDTETSEVETSEDAPAADADDEGDTDDTSDEPVDEAPESDDPDPEIEFPGEDGQTIRLRKSELRNSVLRQQDYTRKTMAVAEEKRAIAAERQLYVQKLQAAEELLAVQATEPDWQQLEQSLTPEEFSAAHARWSIQQRNLEKVQAEKAREQQKLHADWQESRRAQAAVEQQKLLELVPDWRDPKKRDAQQQEAVAFALKMGYTPEMLGELISASDIAVLHKAAQYDKLQQRVKAAKPVVTGKPATPSVAPSKPRSVPRAGPPPAQAQYQKDRAALRKSGSMDDAARALTHLFDD